MKTLHIAVVDKVATYFKRDGEIVCGNTDYQIEFAFDSEWDAYNEKTARFIWNGQHTEVSFTGNICPAPMFTNTTAVTVGVYAGNLCTTTPAQIPCKPSILCGNTNLTEPDQHHTSVAEQAASAASASATAAAASKTAAQAAQTEAERQATSASASASAAAQSAAHAEAVTENTYSRIDRTDKRVTNLERSVYGDLAREVVDDSVAYVKDVPAAAKPYARVDMIGGMTYRVNIGTEEAPEYVLRSAKVTEVKSVGVNKFNIDDLTDAATKINDRTIATTFPFSLANIKVIPNKKYVVTGITYGGDNPTGVQFSVMDGKYAVYGNDTLGISVGFTVAEKAFAFVFTAKSEWISLQSLSPFVKDLMVKEGEDAQPYTPYVKHTLPIPEAVRSKPWYGLGVPNSTAFNAIRYNEDGSRSGDVRCGVVDLSTLGWSVEGGLCWTYALVNVAVQDVGLCDKYEVLPETAMDNAADKTLQIRGDVLYIKDASITDASQITGTLLYALATPTTEDISDILPADNMLPVQAGGTATAVNEHNDAVPWTITFVAKEVTE